MMRIIGSFSEFEGNMLRERTRNRLTVARKKGCIGGRRPKLNLQQQQEIIKLVSSEQSTAADAARLFKVHPSTIYQTVVQRKIKYTLQVLACFKSRFRWWPQYATRERLAMVK
jgi:DNA invertase Pin-like site-specific DNA recombinase